MEVNNSIFPLEQYQHIVSCVNIIMWIDIYFRHFHSSVTGASHPASVSVSSSLKRGVSTGLPSVMFSSMKHQKKKKNSAAVIKLAVVSGGRAGERAQWVKAVAVKTW